MATLNSQKWAAKSVRRVTGARDWKHRCYVEKGFAPVIPTLANGARVGHPAKALILFWGAFYAALEGPLFHGGSYVSKKQNSSPSTSLRVGMTRGDW